MSTINGLDILGNSNVWVFRSPSAQRKAITIAGQLGTWTMRTAVNPMQLIIMGRDGSPALLQAASDLELNDIERDIEALIIASQPVPWSDDHGRSGNELLLVSYERIGHRHYSTGLETRVYQYYRIVGYELSGVLYV